jgi:hypothetical protein
MAQFDGAGSTGAQPAPTAQRCAMRGISISRGSSRDAARQVAGILLFCFSLASCSGGGPKSGVDVLTTVTDLLAAGHGAEAEKLVAAQRPIEISYLDPDDPAYCTPAAFSYRLDGVGYVAAQTLVGLDKQHADQVTRFAIANNVFNSKLSEQDSFVSELCTISAGEAQAGYATARASLASAMATILANLRSDAEAQVGKSHLDQAVKLILAERAKASDASFAADCAERKAHPRQPQINDPPILAQAEGMIRENCERAGYWR